jgi:hypothetical protein
MTGRDGLDRRLRSYFVAEAPERAPEHLERAVRRRLEDVRQDRALARVVGWRWVTTAIAAAAVIALGLGVLPLGIGPSVGQPTLPATAIPASPTASPTAVASVPSPAGVPAGAAFASTKLLVPVRLAAPDGWLVTIEDGYQLKLSQHDAGVLIENNGYTFFDEIGFYVDPLPGPPDGAPTPVAGVGTDAKSIAAWLASRAQVIASQPRKTTVGGRPAWTLDVRLSASTGGLCGVPCVNLINSPDGNSHYAYGLWGPGSSRMTFVDVAAGRVLLISIDDVDGRGVDQLRSAAQSVVESIRFP